MESGDIRLEVVTPTGLVLDTQCTEVIGPGFEGQFGARPGHQPYLVQLRTGALGFRQGQSVDWLAITGGTAEVGANHVVVLADASETREAIDIPRAEQAKDRAAKRLASRDKDAALDRARAQRALDRAEVRLKVALKNL